jgi:hypothetical protein
VASLKDNIRERHLFFLAIGRRRFWSRKPAFNL